VAKDVEKVWLVETLRVTAFGETSVELGQSWWLSVISDDPDSETIKSKLGQYHASCEMLGGVLSLEVHPSRVDWLLRANRASEVESLEFPTIDAFDKVTPQFVRICNSWLSKEPSIDRLAYGAVLFMPTAEREQGYSLLDKYLPSVDVDGKGSADFFYQINRPRPSELDVAELEINRLSKWSVLRLKAGNIRFDSDKPVASAALHEAFAVRLELDVNTSANYANLLPVNSLNSIFGELISLGSEISELGDVK